MTRSNPAYLVCSEGRNGRPTIKRVTQGWPALDPGEVVIRVALELPDDFLSNPLHVVEIEREAITVAVAADDEVER